MLPRLLALCLVPALAAPAPAFDDWDGLHSAVLAVGDLDADGVDDAVVAHRPRPFGMSNAPSEAIPVVEQQPRIWALSGSDGAVLWTAAGFERFGTKLARVGDLDGDGVADLATSEDVPAGTRVPNPRLAAEPEPDEQGRTPVLPATVPHPDAGKARVVLLSGASGLPLGTLVPPGSPHRFGTGLAGGLQVIGDSTPDLVVGSHGRVWLVDGATLEPVLGYRLDRTGKVHRGLVAGWVRPEGPEGTAWMPADMGEHNDFGNSLALVPDVDGDGLAELVIGGQKPEGLGPDTGLVDVEGREPGGLATWMLFSAGVEPDLVLDGSAWCATGLPDVDGDEVPDLAVATVDQHLRVWSVGKRALLWEQRWDSGYMVAEGTSLATVADRDGDGLRDLMVAANETAIDCDRGFVKFVSSATGKDGVGRYTGRSDATPEALAPDMDGGFDADVLGDVGGVLGVVVMAPVYQEVRLLAGDDLEPRWVRSFDELLAEATVVEAEPTSD